MNILWGDDLLDTTQGLDILGVRGLDQSIEIGLVNGITTISQRARYLSILTWAVGESLTRKAITGFIWEDLEAFLRRVEFLVLASTRVDREINSADASGSLGANLHQEAINKLLAGEDVPIPDDIGGAILGTYLGPCRASGLLVDGDETVYYKLTPRGKELWEARNKFLNETEILSLLYSSGTLNKAKAEAAIPDFSLAALKQRTEEAELLNAALVTPWEFMDDASQLRVEKAYDGINGTINWATSLLEEGSDNAAGIIVRNYHKCSRNQIDDQISLTWTEYEYRRRCHLSLELLLSALTLGLANHEEATISQIVTEWSGGTDFSVFLVDIWPSASKSWSMTARDAVRSVPSNLFSESQMPTNDLRHLLAVDQALAAIALLSATASQTQEMRHAGQISTDVSNPGDQAVIFIEAPPDGPFSDLLEKLIQLAAISHLQTTLRKMGAGQKCSLRFFPEGSLLRPTGLGMSPGHSGDRLTNVLKFLTDIGTLEATDNGLVPASGSV